MSQQQRAMERSIRKSKRTCAALDAAINETDDELLKHKLQNKFERHSAILKEKEKRLNSFCNKFGMQKQNDRVRVVGFNKSVSQKAVHGSNRHINQKNVDNAKKSGIIKAITVEDINLADKEEIISYDCKATISREIEEFKEKGHCFRFDGVHIVDIPTSSNRGIEVLRTNVVDRYGYPQVFLEINKSVFSGRDKYAIDCLFFNANNTVCSSLEEAVIHEIGHAKTIYNRSFANYERINETLKEVHHKDISSLAESDGLECIAECEVLLSRGERLSDKLMEFYQTYTTGGG